MTIAGVAEAVVDKAMVVLVRVRVQGADAVGRVREGRPRYLSVTRLTSGSMFIKAMCFSWRRPRSEKAQRYSTTESFLSVREKGGYGRGGSRKHSYECTISELSSPRLPNHRGWVASIMRGAVAVQLCWLTASPVLRKIGGGLRS